ncbi:MAG: UDP-N-acetylmuramate--L-alanine ligase [Cryobacterium sp.]|nr:UDP-N-acetylmuramate--L-alanine ligase [Cryobacterium sp.]
MPDHFSRLHFVGIGGTGMSGIALIMLSQGVEVTGSDIRETDTVRDLRGRGARIEIGHSRRAIGAPDAVIVTGAVAEDNPEVLEARDRGIPVVHRAVALAWLTGRFELVAVAGAHGKTTSTSMIVSALRELGRDVGFVNGGVIKSLGTSAMPGTDKVFVIEADESDGSFLLYKTSIVLITNVDPDHLDHFGSAEAFKDAFVQFAGTAISSIVISADDAGALEITPRIDAGKVTSFGTSQKADVRISGIESGPVVSFDLHWREEDFPVRLRVPGIHNAVNAAGAFGVLMRLGIPPGDAIDALSRFEGAERRFDLKGEVGGVKVYDDFAHHPTEVRAALLGARAASGGGRIIPIFQPHLFSRTQLMADQFARIFEEFADHTIVVPIYPAREEPIPGVTGELIVNELQDADRGEYCLDWDSAVEAAVRLAAPGDLLIPMGGGDIYRIIPGLLAGLEARFGKQS